MIHRYTTPEMSAIWSEERRFDAWLQIEIAVCEVLAERGEIPEDALKSIKDDSGFTLDRIHALERTTRHEVIAFLTAVAENVGPASRFIHLGMTSSDLMDTGLAMQCLAAGNLLEEVLAEFHGILQEMALRYQYVWQIGRTHGVHAEPISFGLKLALWWEEIGRHRERWRRALTTIATGKLSGAVGTYAHLPPEVESEVCRQLGLEPEPVSNQVVQRDRHAEYLNGVALIGTTLEKIALEIRHLQKTEVLEAEEPFTKGQKGSSAMPHKRNPIVTERICGLARILRANAGAALENVALWHERDISHSSVERVIIPDSTTLLHYMLVKMKAVLEGLVVYPEQMEANLHKTHGLIFSQGVLLQLVRNGLTREHAYSLVQRSALAVWENGGNFHDRLRADVEVMENITSEQLDGCFTFEDLRFKIDAIYNRIGIRKS